jgi:tRNA pseudouridine(38-40) synthase
MKRAAAAAEGPSKAAAVDPRGVGKPELARKPGEARIPKRKLALLLSYRGTQYHGLQRQTDPSLKTIEGEMRTALAKAGAVSPENAEDLAKIGWSRSARTDKRVSAAQNIVAAKLEVENDDVDALVARINDELPDDIRVFDAVRVTKSFNCKQSCDRRRYAYLLPACLLASNNEIDAAFASVGYGPEKIEECRNAVAQAKRDNVRPSDWQISDEAAKQVASQFAACRASSEAIERLRQFLRCYVGTRRYHNFTKNLKSSDEQAKRFILEFTACDPRIVADSTEWLRLEVVGQSFLLHMIRKMVAVASEASRTDRGDPSSLLDGLTSDQAVNLQVAPGEGLYLAAPVFDNYNKYKAQPPQKPKLEWDATHTKHDAIETFRVEVIEDGIVQGGKAEALLPWVLYLWQVRLFGFPLSVEDPIPVPNPAVDANGRSSFSPAAAAEG